MPRWQEQNDYRRGRNCVFLLHAHLVFVTKRRRGVLDGDAIRRLQIIFADVRRSLEAELVRMDGEEDHVHLLVNYPPKLAMSKLVNSLKGVSSRILRRDRPDVARLRVMNSALWSPSYFCGSCGGAPLEIVKRYIQDQKTSV